LQYGLGIARLDWLVLLDPMVNDAKFCWQQLAGLVQVLPQGVVRSEGLSFKSFPESPGAGLIEFGDKRWAIFPQPVSASSFILPKLDGIWLGRSPHEKELIPASAATIWISGSNYQKDNSPTHWQFTGERGWLIW
jgi:competence protein ComEC